MGLDTDILKIPAHLKKEKDPVFEFNKQIIDATADLAVAYKPNIAFYESMGPAGWESLQKTLEYIPDDIFTIADAKRGDIGNTSRMYAKTFFDPASSGLGFHSVTVAPYMGEDSVKPFLEYKGKWVILLALTSNKGSADFQQKYLEENGALFEHVVITSKNWGNPGNLMYVTGATHPGELSRIRKVAPDHFFLVPGVGAQGGSIREVMEKGAGKEINLLINSSRGILYTGDGKNFAEKSRKAAQSLTEEMKPFF